jgi:hypothetical protein
MRNSPFSNCLPGICDAVRAKEDSAGLIPHQDIPGRIAALTGGGANVHTGTFTVSESGFTVPAEWASSNHILVWSGPYWVGGEYGHKDGAFNFLPVSDTANVYYLDTVEGAVYTTDWSYSSALNGTTFSWWCMED